MNKRTLGAILATVFAAVSISEASATAILALKKQQEAAAAAAAAAAEKAAVSQETTDPKAETAKKAAEEAAKAEAAKKAAEDAAKAEAAKKAAEDAAKAEAAKKAAAAADPAPIAAGITVAYAAKPYATKTLMMTVASATTKISAVNPQFVIKSAIAKNVSGKTAWFVDSNGKCLQLSNGTNVSSIKVGSSYDLAVVPKASKVNPEKAGSKALYTLSNVPSGLTCSVSRYSVSIVAATK
ncbi:MAG: hypothetical protein H6849_03285 [Alphaproteobacteria bacterium]|nr:MAG: hypothetical protein H6849_03285 [Alphaproteobacteria bacterium]